MSIRNYFGYLIFSGVILLTSCNGKEKSAPPAEVKEQQQSKPVFAAPMLNADSAYAFVKQQVDFGPRVPGTKAHAACAQWLEHKLRSYIPDVMVQKGIVTTYDNKKFDLKNIIASYNPGNKHRILLCAHWDTRPFADRDEGANKNKVLDGANDGGSGVGVLLEIARQLSITKPDVGVDIILFDLEDYGEPDQDNIPEKKDTWCLGSQYWVKHPHQNGYYAKFGILLDMVGAKGAVFPREGASMHYASALVDRVWNTASSLGYGSYFINAQTGTIVDDHLYINEYASIPTINIIHYNALESDFFDHHHRVTDNMEQIDPKVLGMVGQTVLQVVFEEAGKGIQ
jgi:glutaminyl-peptide cyclotransferase